MNDVGVGGGVAVNDDVRVCVKRGVGVGVGVGVGGDWCW